MWMLKLFWKYIWLSKANTYYFVFPSTSVIRMKVMDLTSNAMLPLPISYVMHWRQLLLVLVHKQNVRQLMACWASCYGCWQLAALSAPVLPLLSTMSIESPPNGLILPQLPAHAPLGHLCHLLFMVPVIGQVLPTTADSGIHIVCLVAIFFRVIEKFTILIPVVYFGWELLAEYTFCKWNFFNV